MCCHQHQIAIDCKLIKLPSTVNILCGNLPIPERKVTETSHVCLPASDRSSRRNNLWAVIWFAWNLIRIRYIKTLRLPVWILSATLKAFITAKIVLKRSRGWGPTFLWHRATPVVTSVCYVTQSRTTVGRLRKLEAATWLRRGLRLWDVTLCRVTVAGTTGGSIVTERWRGTYASVGTAAS
jgi:hypothetical protein